MWLFPKKHLFLRQSSVHIQEINQVLKTQRYEKKGLDIPKLLKMPGSDWILVYKSVNKCRRSVSRCRKLKDCENPNKTNSAWKRNSQLVKIQSVVFSLETTLSPCKCILLYFD